MMKVDLDTAEIHHLLAHLRANSIDDGDGWYFNQKIHFDKTHKKLIEKLENILKG